MDGKLVYRGLRQISDWALRFYCDIYVDGEENVPKDGPLIITPCHHNEILDIATLAMNIPHGRPVCFWAKSSMFQNPLVRSVLLSSGSIPVARNPNTTPVPAESGTATQALANEALFRGTFKALEREEIIGVFPEGTSYTEPSIAQVKDGASRAALEYVKWRRETKGKETTKSLKVVPVGIVYTDKTQYQSKVCVRWGKPVDIEAFVDVETARGREGKVESDSKEVIKALTTEIEKGMRKLTINAPNWNTLYAAQMAREILWADEEIQLSDFVQISQNLVDLFADPDAAPSVAKAIQALLRYHSLLDYADISHSSLNAILPYPQVTQIGRIHTFSILIRQLLVSLLHPRFFLFCPSLVLHIPAYAAGLVADRLLGKRDEPETRAQFKTIFGGLAAAMAYSTVTYRIVRGLETNPVRVMARLEWKGYIWHREGGLGLGLLGKVFGILGIFYVTSFVLSRWHNYWVGSNYRQFKRLLASVKLLLGILMPKSVALTGAMLAPYTTPYIPPSNPYIKRREGTSELKSSTPRAPFVLSYKLVRPLLEARAEATRSLWSFLVDSKYLHGLVTSEVRKEVWMQVGPAKPHSNC